jgi:hypothetical protein
MSCFLRALTALPRERDRTSAVDTVGELEEAARNRGRLERSVIRREGIEPPTC